MKNCTLRFIGALIFIHTIHLTAETPKGFNSQYPPIPAQQVYMQVNNINTVFRTDGIFNYDKITFPGGDAGLIYFYLKEKLYLK